MWEPSVNGLVRMFDLKVTQRRPDRHSRARVRSDVSKHMIIEGGPTLAAGVVVIMEGIAGGLVRVGIDAGSPFSWR